MANGLDDENKPLPPVWDIIGPDDNGLMVLEWKGSTSAHVTGLPLGDVKHVRAKLKETLEELDRYAAS